MPRRSRSKSSVVAGKSRVYSPPSSNVRQDSRQRFDITPVIRQKWLDEGNKALQTLLRRSKAYQVASSPRVDTPRLKTPRAAAVSLVSTVSAKARSQLGQSTSRSGTRFGLGLSFPTLKKLGSTLVCVKRKMRRELVFASGGGGSRRNVPVRAAPSKVRC